jgi:hypothetical protein
MAKYLFDMRLPYDLTLFLFDSLTLFLARASIMPLYINGCEQRLTEHVLLSLSPHPTDFQSVPLPRFCVRLPVAFAEQGRGKANGIPCFCLLME